LRQQSTHKSHSPQIHEWQHTHGKQTLKLSGNKFTII
jgi:hypothetical protein